MFLKKIQIILLILVLTSCGKPKDSNKNSIFVPQQPILSTNTPIENQKKNGDILRSEDKEFMDSINSSSLTAVTREFGPTIIKEKVFPFKSEVAKAEFTPWSSWWYPKKDRSLFDDSNAANETDYSNLSTLSKFDLYKRTKNQNTPSAQTYEKNFYDINALPWEGLCDAWALASITAPEPKHPVSFNIKRPGSMSRFDKITFEIVDLKALLLKTFEAIDDNSINYYGQKFTGQENGWIYPDLFPEQFHRFLEIQLFGLHKPFIIDLDQGIEIWNVPVFKANFIMASIPNEPNSIFVRTWVYMADSIKSNDRSFVGTREVVREYDYVLQGERNQDGDLVINLGYWVKGPNGNDSRRDHPDFIMAPKNSASLIRKSWNPEIDITTVDEILKESY